MKAGRGEDSTFLVLSSRTTADFSGFQQSERSEMES